MIRFYCWFYIKQKWQDGLNSLSPKWGRCPLWHIPTQTQSPRIWRPSSAGMVPPCVKRATHLTVLELRVREGWDDAWAGPRTWVVSLIAAAAIILGQATCQGCHSLETPCSLCVCDCVWFSKCVFWGLCVCVSKPYKYPNVVDIKFHLSIGTHNS